ncbi:hypothetical protein O181_093791 [Austropuccinia psidii MF-1]|uniref:Uncharacterized protein n=1 Tax=Austropuccinia psidii MF-1 TaxID=1389203 RepID=A0A9Q3PBU0_9BASI|nr:hypothetical protein [Austropuccinia psidii MF-1]
MSSRPYSSMHIFICQHCSTQTHSSAEGDRQGAAFTPLQYKKHIDKLKSTISPKSFPNIPTSASASECSQILLDQIFPADYSQLIKKELSPLQRVSIQLHRNHTVEVQPFPHKTLEC